MSTGAGPFNPTYDQTAHHRVDYRFREFMRLFGDESKHMSTREIHEICEDAVHRLLGKISGQPF